MKAKKSGRGNSRKRRKAIPADVRLNAWLRRYGLKVPNVRLTPKREQLLKAEIEVRWPYYRRNKEYLELARRKCESAKEFLNLITRARRVQSSALENAKLSGGTDALKARMNMLDEQCEQKFGLPTIVPPSLTTQQVLAGDFWRAQFINVDPPVWCDVNPEMLDRWIREKPPALSPSDLWKTIEVPIRIRINRSKSEILRAVEAVVKEWQKVFRRVYKATWGSLPNRERLPDCKLFADYVKAVELSEHGQELKEMPSLLWPSETATATATLTARAKLYLDNGKLLLSGKSYQIGEKMPKS